MIFLTIFLLQSYISHNQPYLPCSALTESYKKLGFCRIFEAAQLWGSLPKVSEASLGRLPNLLTSNRKGLTMFKKRVKVLKERFLQRKWCCKEQQCARLGSFSPVGSWSRVEQGQGHRHIIHQQLVNFPTSCHPLK